MENITLTMNESSNQGENVQLENIELLTDEIVQLEVDCPICAYKYNNSTH